jgi:predicted DCC family thiol-disulfide oxidoreductase YuxK
VGASRVDAHAGSARLSSVWDRFWFGEASLVRLGAFRIVLLATALHAVQQNAMGVFQHSDELASGFHSRVWDPIYAFQLLGIEPMGPAVARVVWASLWISICAGIVGVWTRYSCAVAAVLVFLWIGTSYSFGKPHHDCVPLMFGLLALPFSPVGARLSIDAWMARIRRTRRGADPAFAPERAPCAALPWRLVQVTIAIGYFFSGASKLAIGGPTWANGFTLQGTLLEFNSPWTATFARSAWLCQWMSIGLLFVQITFPLVFVSRRLRWFYVPMGVVFHVFAWQTMATGTFANLWFTLASFIALDRVPGFVHRRSTRGAALWRAAWVVLATAAAGFVVWIYTANFEHAFEWVFAPIAASIAIAAWPRSKLHVIYDGGCGVCRTAIACVKGLDWSRRLELVDLHRTEEVRALGVPLDEAACLRDLHAVSAKRRVIAGYDAYRAIAARLPLACWFAPIMALPGVRHIGRRIYRRVADHRVSGTCAIDA